MMLSSLQPHKVCTGFRFPLQSIILHTFLNSVINISCLADETNVKPRINMTTKHQSYVVISGPTNSATDGNITTKEKRWVLKIKSIL